MNLLLRSLCIFLALVSCQASRRWSSSINTLDFVDGSNAVINAYIYKKERSSDLYPAKIKRVYKGCNLEQYETILIDVGHPSNKKCDVDLRSGQRYLLFGHVMDSVAAAYDQRSSAGQKGKSCNSPVLVESRLDSQIAYNSLCSHGVCTRPKNRSLITE